MSTMYVRATPYLFHCGAGAQLRENTDYGCLVTTNMILFSKLGLGDWLTGPTSILPACSLLIVTSTN
jgi:hypothetical protein